MILTNKDFSIELKFGTWNLWQLAEIRGKMHPFQIFDENGEYGADYKLKIDIIRAGISNPETEYVATFAEASDVLDKLGGIKTLKAWDRIFIELIKLTTPEEVIYLNSQFQKMNEAEKKKATKKIGTEKSKQPLK